MNDLTRFYIGGQWVSADARPTMAIVDPHFETVIGSVALGNGEDVDAAVAAAREAFGHSGIWSREDRIEWLSSMIAGYERRFDDLVEAVHLEMGAPRSLARSAHVPSGKGHIRRAIDVLREYSFDQMIGNTIVTREAIGVCGLITPWNWPLNQLTCKVAPAIAAGCTVVLKPSERASLSAQIIAEIMHDAGVPPGIFNMVFGDGPVVGEAMSSHPDIDMISFTGSTRAGISVAKAAADTVKRVAQELGGKSANVILGDADLERAIAHGVMSCFRNSGQSCNSPTRMLIPRRYQALAVDIAKMIADSICFDDEDASTAIGPLANRPQFDRVQSLIAQAIGEGTLLIAGGIGRPESQTEGLYAKPTVFADVTSDMMIAQQEVFGPVLCIMPYDSEEEAVSIANSSVYGLSGYVFGGTIERAASVARRLRTGMVHLNGSKANNAAPFGGYKQSGNGREWGVHGFEDYLEVKSIFQG